MNNSHILKQYTTQLKKIDAEIEGLKLESSRISKEMAQKYKTKEDLLKKIDSLSKSDKIVISEHAVLRYCERVLGLNLDEISKQILNEDVLQLVTRLDYGNGEYPSKNNEGSKFKIVLKNNVIVTII